MNSATLAFLGGLAHELRTPLGAIGGYAELMELGVHGPVTAAQEDGLGRIRRNQSLMVSLLNAFMAYAEIAAGDVELVPRRVAVQEALDSVVAHFASSADNRGVRIACPLDRQQGPTTASGLHVLADARALASVFREVLRDGVESSPAGGAVRVVLRPTADGARVEATSDGTPFDEATAAAAFRPFDREAKGARTSASPHALSLPHAQLLARLMGFDVRAVPSSAARIVVVELNAAP